MPVKPPRPEGGSKTTYIPTDFFPYKYFVLGWTRTRTEDVCSSVQRLYRLTDGARNKEIQEFLVKIKMLFLRSLEIFISYR